jgi:hypothetical protein
MPLAYVVRHKETVILSIIWFSNLLTLSVPVAIKNGQSRDTGNIDKDKQNTNTAHYVLDTTMRKQTQIIWSILQTTGGKDEPRIQRIWQYATNEK